MRSSDWSSDVCSSDLIDKQRHNVRFELRPARLEDAQYALRTTLALAMPAPIMSTVLDMQKCVSRCLRDIEDWHGTTQILASARVDRYTARTTFARELVENFPGARLTAEQAEAVRVNAE